MQNRSIADSAREPPRLVCEFSTRPTELQDVIYEYLQIEGKFKTLANLNVCSKILSEVSRPHLYKEVHWKAKDCKAQRALFLETGQVLRGWEHIQYLFIRSDAAVTEWYELLHEFRKSLQQPYTVDSDKMHHTFFPKIVFQATPDPDFPVRRGYFLETTTTVWAFNISARNATFEDPELINTMLRAIYKKGDPQDRLTRHFRKVHGLPYLNFMTPPVRPRKKRNDDEEDSERWSSDEEMSEAGKKGEPGSAEGGKVEKEIAGDDSESASVSPQLVPTLVESDDEWTDEDDEDRDIHDDEDSSDFDDGMPKFYAPALARDLQLDIPQAEIIVVRFFNSEGRYADNALATECAYKMFLASNDLCRGAIDVIKEEFTLTVGVNDLANIKSWINTIAEVSSDRIKHTGKTTALAEVVFDLDLGFGPDDFLSWIYRIQEKLLSDFSTDQEIRALPCKISFDTARGAPIPFDATSCLRAVVDLSSVEKASYVRSGLWLRNSIDLLGARVQKDGKELAGEAKTNAERLLGAKLIS